VGISGAATIAAISPSGLRTRGASWIVTLPPLRRALPPRPLPEHPDEAEKSLRISVRRTPSLVLKSNDAAPPPAG
jgi:hypothetical protein